MYGKLFKSLRNKLGQTQIDFARRIGVSQGEISKIENGVAIPSLPVFKTAYRLAQKTPLKDAFRRSLTLGLSALFLTSLLSCAGAQLEKEWRARGYQKPQIDLIYRYASPYKAQLARGIASSNRFNSMPYQDAQTRVRAIYCVCVKELGPRCQGRPNGMTQSQYLTWLKGNAAEMSLKSVGTVNLMGSAGEMLDPAECR